MKLHRLSRNSSITERAGNKEAVQILVYTLGFFGVMICFFFAILVIAR